MVINLRKSYQFIITLILLCTYFIHFILHPCSDKCKLQLSEPFSIYPKLFFHCNTPSVLFNISFPLSSRPLKSVNTWNRSPFWNALSREFRCRWRHLSCKLRPEIDNRFTFTLIKPTMRFKQIRKDIYRFWCQNGAILLLSFWLNNESQIFPEKHSP